MENGENKQPICPNCGRPLVLSTHTIGIWSRKIKKDGSLYKIINKSCGHPNGISFLQCEKYGCKFSYNIDYASCDEPIPELNAWIENHRKELW